MTVKNAQENVFWEQCINQVCHEYQWANICMLIISVAGVSFILLLLVIFTNDKTLLLQPEIQKSCRSARYKIT